MEEEIVVERTRSKVVIRSILSEIGMAKWVPVSSEAKVRYRRVEDANGMGAWLVSFQSRKTHRIPEGIFHLIPPQTLDAIDEVSRIGSDGILSAKVSFYLPDGKSVNECIEISRKAKQILVDRESKLDSLCEKAKAQAQLKRAQSDKELYD